MRKLIFICTGFFILSLMFSCNQADGESEKQPVNKSGSKEMSDNNDVQKNIRLTLKQANNLAELPLSCMQVEYPNKLGQTLGGGDDLGEPHQLHPAFYGCFDWHSAVHGHWSLIKLLKDFPLLKKADLMKPGQRTFT